MSARRFLTGLVVAVALVAPGSASAAAEPAADHCASVRLGYVLGYALIKDKLAERGWRPLAFRCRVVGPKMVTETWKLRALRDVRVRDWRGSYIVHRGERACMIDTLRPKRGKWRSVDITWWAGDSC